MQGRKTPDGFKKTVFGKYVLRSRVYLAWLHEMYPGPDIQLHHFAPEGRSNDALVIPLSSANHKKYEDHPRTAEPMMTEWYEFAARHFFAFMTKVSPADVVFADHAWFRLAFGPDTPAPCRGRDLFLEVMECYYIKTH